MASEACLPPSAPDLISHEACTGLYCRIVYIAGSIASPRQTFTLMLFDAQGLGVSFFVILTIAILSAFAALAFDLAGFSPFLAPWLAIPSSAYYFCEALFIVPVMLAGWVLTSGFVQLMAKRFGGGGSFDATARLLALAIALPTLVILIPGIVLGLLATANEVDARWWFQEIRMGGIVAGIACLLMVIEAGWMVILVSIAIRVVHKLRTRRSLLLAILTAIAYHGFMMIFVR
jgi:hypothetical protein